VDRITNVILIKLLQISIVARSNLGLSSSLTMTSSFGFSLVLIDFSWEGESEKKATSQAEIKADANNNKGKRIKRKIMPNETTLVKLLYEHILSRLINSGIRIIFYEKIFP
jgi:hypothetical protein